MTTAPFTYRRHAHSRRALSLLTHLNAQLPLVRVGGIQNAFDDRVRVDFTEAVRAPVLRNAPQPDLDFAMLGGEPYARWV